jgi:hypothetical protein
MNHQTNENVSQPNDEVDKIIPDWFYRLQEINCDKLKPIPRTRTLNVYEIFQDFVMVFIAYVIIKSVIRDLFYE